MKIRMKMRENKFLRLANENKRNKKILNPQTLR